MLVFKKCFVSHVRQRKTIWKWIKDRLTSLVASTQWAGRARDDGQLLNSVIGWERGMSVFMMCVHCCRHLAVCVHCLPSTFVVTQRRERKNSTYMRWTERKTMCVNRGKKQVGESCEVKLATHFLIVPNEARHVLYVYMLLHHIYPSVQQYHWSLKTSY